MLNVVEVVQQAVNIRRDRFQERYRKSILLPTLTYELENWTWNGAQQSRMHAVEMSYLRGACGVSRLDGMSNKSVYESCSMSGCGSGVGCSVVKWVKRSTPRWCGHIERMENEEFVKMVYLSSVEGMDRRGRPLGRWDDRVKEYVSESEGKWVGVGKKGVHG